MKNQRVSYPLTNPEITMRTPLFVLLLFVLRSSLCPAQSPIEPKTLKAIDRYIDTLQQTWNIPGLALAIVYKDQLVYAKGYGYRNVEQQLPVTPTTLFPIASNTKLFTATAACLLAEEGKLDLHQPASTYLPSLKFFTDELTAKVTLSDMLSHRTGLPRYDGIWAGAAFTRPEIIQKIVYMKPALGFREGYLYNNMMYVAAGAVLEAVSGQSWEQLIEGKILNPLGMTNSCFTDEQMGKTGNYATSYYEPDTTQRLVPVSVKWQCGALGPAGTLRSNLEDMSHWMIAQLNSGKYVGKAVFPEKVIQQTLIPNNISDKEGRYDELSHAL
ncbi:MAG: serine hydrolase domain-containing protein, partial [Chitinophagaceae bacterium]